MADIKEKIVVIGLGWVGQANALVLKKMGYQVFFYDPKEPELHYTEYEDVFSELVRIKAPLDEDGKHTWYIVCVGDRVSSEGEQDISLIKKATDSLQKAKGKVILRSTVLPDYLGRLKFDIYVPEFLHEKHAIEESMNPHFFVIGAHTDIELPSFLKLWERKAHRVFRGTPQEASYVKYLSNIWNSVRIAFVNEFGDGIEKPVNQAAIRRIEKVINFVLGGQNYLKYGKAFKGHCLPKDTRAFMAAYKRARKNATLLEAAHISNNIHLESEEEFSALPEWFSLWDYKKQSENLFIRLWEAFNDIRVIRRVRKRLRFIIDWISKLIPARSISNSRRIWEKRAQENAAFYSNFYKRFSKQMSEKELKDEGYADYCQYVLADALVTEGLGNFGKKRVLDLGCGIGRITEALAGDFKDVHGIDIAPTMIKKAKSRLQNTQNVSFSVSDGEHIPYPDNNFDFVFSYSTLQHVPSTQALTTILSEVHRVLHPRGVAKLQLGTGRGYKKWNWAHGVTLSLEDAQELAEGVGFTVKDHEVESIDNMWLVLAK